jgi:hypothetical protein
MMIVTGSSTSAFAFSDDFQMAIAMSTRLDHHVDLDEPFET